MECKYFLLPLAKYCTSRYRPVMAKPGYKRFDEWVAKVNGLGYPMRDIADWLGISMRRLHQLRKPGCGIPRLRVLRAIEEESGIPAKAWLL